MRAVRVRISDRKSEESGQKWQKGWMIREEKAIYRGDEKCAKGVKQLKKIQYESVCLREGKKPEGNDRDTAGRGNGRSRQGR